MTGLNAKTQRREENNFGFRGVWTVQALLGNGAYHIERALNPWRLGVGVYAEEPTRVPRIRP